MLLSRSALRPCKAPRGGSRERPASLRGGATRPRTNKGLTFPSSFSHDSAAVPRVKQRLLAPRAHRGGDDGCPFEALGIPADASSEEIKKAYRRQAAQLVPRRFPWKAETRRWCLFRFFKLKKKKTPQGTNFFPSLFYLPSSFLFSGTTRTSAAPPRASSKSPKPMPSSRGEETAGEEAGETPLLLLTTTLLLPLLLPRGRSTTSSGASRRSAAPPGPPGRPVSAPAGRSSRSTRTATARGEEERTTSPRAPPPPPPPPAAAAARPLAPR